MEIAHAAVGGGGGGGEGRSREAERECSTLMCFIYIADTLLHGGTGTGGEERGGGGGGGGDRVDACVTSAM